MSQDSSSRVLDGSIDLSKQTGIMAVLAAVRASTITPAQKSELRDLVFTFTNGGRDETVRLQLEQKLTAYGVTVTPLPTQTTASTAVTTFGTIRPVPSFAPVQVTTSLAADTPQTPPVLSPAVSIPAPVLPSAPVFTPPPAPLSSPSVPITPQVSTTPSSPVPTEASSVTAREDVNLERIRTIKAIVNEQVGNPVNLVDIDNTVGREYMAALLDAMKKINAGNAGVAAMERLEVAFVAVQAVLAAHSAGAAKDNEINNAPITQPVAVEVSMNPAASNLVDAEPVSGFASQPTSPDVPLTHMGDQRPAASVASDQVDLNTRALEPVSTSIPVVSEQVEPVDQVTPITSSLRPGVQPAPAPVQSLAEQSIRLRTPLDLPDPASVSALGPNEDPLLTKEVDAGLEQLLLEWSLFKKSGLFGTGPKGREHPLFKKVSGLPIPLLLAGRFDGATQEIKQSITDYMNGWRYEQGVVYDQGETFEHYLRRVIRHIIDLQKQRLAK